jgi:hypothetical protein
VETLIKIRDYITALQTEYNALVDELNTMALALDASQKEIDRLKKRSSGFWLGALAGIPFPSASVQGMYVINNNIGIMLNAGYAGKTTIQLGGMVRVGK